MPEELNRRADLLVAEVHGLSGVVQLARDELAEANDRAEQAHASAERTRSWLWVLGTVLGTAVLVAAAAFGGAYYLIHQNNLRFCVVIATAIDPSQPPPATARGRAQFENFRKLGSDLGCPNPPLTG